MLYALLNENCVNMGVAVISDRVGSKAFLLCLYHLILLGQAKLPTVTLVKNTGLGSKNLDWLTWYEF